MSGDEENITINTTESGKLLKGPNRFQRRAFKRMLRKPTNLGTLKIKSELKKFKRKKKAFMEYLKTKRKPNE